MPNRDGSRAYGSLSSARTGYLDLRGVAILEALSAACSGDRTQPWRDQSPYEEKGNVIVIAGTRRIR
jgi:hypothetical protein